MVAWEQQLVVLLQGSAAPFWSTWRSLQGVSHLVFQCCRFVKETARLVSLGFCCSFWQVMEMVPGWDLTVVKAAMVVAVWLAGLVLPF